jgi:pilus assembly protein CpaB
MRGKSIALLMLALGCGLVASIGITQVLARRHAEPPAPAGESATIFVALTDIGLGDILSSRDLRLEQWPKDKVPASSLSRIEDVEGRRTRTKLYAGEPILDNKLFAKGAESQGTTALIPKGYRVVSVKVDSVSGGSNLIMPGDRVDLLVYLVRNPNRGIPETITRTILQDIKVFAVNNIVTPDTDKEGRSIKAATISLLVTPEQAAKVTLASELGQIRLVMRSPDDDTDAPNAQASPMLLLGGVEKGERERESLAASPPEAEPPAGGGFLDVLRAAQARMTAPRQPDALPADGESGSWMMRILRPDGVEDVVLEMNAAMAAAGTAGPSWKPWSPGGPAEAPPAPTAEPDGPPSASPDDSTDAPAGGTTDEAADGVADDGEAVDPSPENVMDLLFGPAAEPRDAAEPSPAIDEGPELDLEKAGLQLVD